VLGRNLVESGAEVWGLPEDALSRRARAVATAVDDVTAVVVRRQP
jgi:hypothetical protein